MLLYRPVGLNELALVYETGMQAFPPRLPEQPIFYPVLNEGYARQIADEWNARSGTRAGFVTRFAIEPGYAGGFERRVVGGREHEELWVPAEELATFNRRLEGPIEIVAAYFGAPYVGDVPERGALAGAGAAAQLDALAALDDAALERVVDECHRSVYLNFFFWQSPAAGAAGPARDALLGRVRRAWQRGGKATPLGFAAAGPSA